jgi:phage gpG-like protein
MVRLSLTIDGEQAVSRRLLRWQQAADNAAPLFATIADAWAEANRRQFDSRGGYGGVRWQPLSPAYAAWKATVYPGQPIMEATGALRRSLTGGWDVYQIGPRSMRVGSNVAYGKYHQSRRPRRRLPRRPVVVAPEEFRREAVKLTQRYFVEQADRL